MSNEDDGYRFIWGAHGAHGPFSQAEGGYYPPRATANPRRPTRPPGNRKPTPSTWFGLFDEQGRLLADTPGLQRPWFDGIEPPHHGGHPSRVIRHSVLGSFLVYADYKGRGIWIIHRESGLLVVGPDLGRVRFDDLDAVLDALEQGIQKHGLILLGFLRE